MLINKSLGVTTVHVAGIQIKIGKYCIQRCIICGCALVLDDLSKMMVAGTDKLDPLFFKTGTLVEVDDNSNGIKSSIHIGELEENFKVEDLPKNICLDLLEI